MTRAERTSIEQLMALAIRGMEEAVEPDIQNMPSAYSRKAELFNLNRGYYDGIKDFIATTDRHFGNELVQKFIKRYNDALDKYQKIEQTVYYRTDGKGYKG